MLVPISEGLPVPPLPPLRLDVKKGRLGVTVYRVVSISDFTGGPSGPSPPCPRVARILISNDPANGKICLWTHLASCPSVTHFGVLSCSQPPGLPRPGLCCLCTVYPPTRQDGADAHQKRVKQARPRRKHTNLADMSSQMKESKMTLEMHPKALCPARKLAGPWDYRMTRALRTT